AKSIAERLRTVIFLFMFFASPIHSTLYTRPVSLDHFVGPRQHVRWNNETDLLCCFQIDDELELCRLLDWQVRGLCAFQDFVHVSCGAAIQVGIAHAVEHEAPIFHIFWPVVYRWQPALYRAVCNLLSLRNKDFVRQYEDCVSALLACGLKCSFD